MRAQSPLSFGGFGALTRHLGRLTGAVHEALQAGAVDAASLSLIHGYNPGLSSSWMLQQAMSVRAADAPPPSTLINKMLGERLAWCALPQCARGLLLNVRQEQAVCAAPG